MVNVIDRARRVFGSLCWTAAVLFVVVVQPIYLLPVEQQLPIVLAITMMGLFAQKPLFSRGRSLPLAGLIDLSLIVAAAVTGYYVASNYQAIINRQGAFTPADIRVSVVAVVLVFDAIRRSVGWPLTIVGLVFVGYALFGRSMPGLLLHRGYSFETTTSHLLLTYSGIYGTPLKIMIRYVIIFILFGALLQAVGGSNVLVRFARALAGRYTGGLGKVAVIASALVGSVSGSAAGNVATTGSVTIPAMKLGGYPPHVAGAIESVASTGGQIMPPIMGAAAFLVADYLGVPYGRIALAATLPAVLYFLSAGMAVDLYSRARGLRGMPRDRVEPLVKVLREGWLYIVPIFAIYALLIAGYSPTLSALVGLGMAALLLVVKRVGVHQIAAALEEAGKSAATLSVVAAGAGIVVGVMQLTGLGARLASILVDLSMGSSFILLLLAMVTSIILGLGMPTTVVYVLLVSLVVPALVRMGIEPISAHFFIFYFGVLAAITPPVALASYAAASIAGSSPDRTGWTALKMALPAFIIPFFFARNPALLLQGAWHTVMLSTASAAIGVCILAVAIMNYLQGPLRWWARVLAAAAALLLIRQGIVTDVAGLGLFLLVWLFQVRAHPPGIDPARMPSS
ncbi:TRAP transporter permease [Limnochorda pilosa]|uniref:C4-dicarboxylate ABC transporter n=1 Tax=Limnochorda pilosa TaxID=1555112 RepID=A0A0K2SM62_LIMPI|nr:TRAP transporter fused permease subunit [Limnochorda pilosa]BAS28196.1 C4-dicarboxylate ABC transporter [Limnochorda pilosa]